MARSPRTRATLPKLTDRLSLGDGLEVSPICLGMVDSPDVVPAAFDAGINFFFLTADMHWPLYEPVRKGLAKLLARGGGIRDQVVVCATAYVTQADFCHLPFEETVAAVPGLGRLDVLCAGGVYASDFSGRLTVYRSHRDKSFVGCRAVAASFHERQVGRVAIEHELVDLAFVRFNAGHPGAMRDLFPALPARRRTRVFNFKNVDGWVAPGRLDALGLAADAWRPHQTDHYRFALSQPQLDGALVALERPAQVAQLAEALAKGPLDEESQHYLMTLAQADLST